MKYMMLFAIGMALSMIAVGIAMGIAELVWLVVEAVTYLEREMSVGECP